MIKEKNVKKVIKVNGEVRDVEPTAAIVYGDVVTEVLDTPPAAPTETSTKETDTQ